MHTQASGGSTSRSPTRLPFSSLVCQQNERNEQRAFQVVPQAPAGSRNDEEDCEAEELFIVDNQDVVEVNEIDEKNE